MVSTATTGVLAMGEVVGLLLMGIKGALQEIVTNINIPKLNIKRYRFITLFDCVDQHEEPMASPLSWWMMLTGFFGGMFILSPQRPPVTVENTSLLAEFALTHPSVRPRDPSPRQPPRRDRRDISI